MAENKEPVLTIGMASFRDYDGTVFTIQALRRYHAGVMGKCEILVVDSAPDTPEGKDLAKFCRATQTRYIKHDGPGGTAQTRNQVFREALGKYVLCTDCHVLFDPGAIRALIDYYAANPETSDLIQGPLLHDGQGTAGCGACGQAISTHMSREWGPSGNDIGRWQRDERGLDPKAEAFEIPMHGLGVFSCRKDAWLGFNEHFREFGSEESYISEKYRRAGHKVLCLPALRWWHRFGRPGGVPYPLTAQAKFRNYILGHAELGLDLAHVVNQYKPKVGAEWIEKVLAEACALYPPDGKKPNIVVLGVGHSGTTVLSKMLCALGWERNDADEAFYELEGCRKVNMAHVPLPFGQEQEFRAAFDVEAAKAELAKLKDPWVFKDPRLVLNLDQWTPLFGEKPLVVQITKDIERVKQSYEKRGEKLPDGTIGLYGHSVEQLADKADEQFRRYDGPKYKLDYSQLAAAVSVFDLKRAAA